jgi:hypothetical protein
MEPEDLPAARLAICITALRENAGELIRALSAQPEAADCALLLHVDGADDQDLTAAHHVALAGYPGPSAVHLAAEPRGRTAAREWLVAHAPADWILLLDAGLMPGGPDFLARHLAAAEDAAGPALISGGLSLAEARPDMSTRLHHTDLLSGIGASAETRQADPARYVSSAHALVHRDILMATAFDAGFACRQQADIDWSLRVAASWPVLQIDNPAACGSLEDDAGLLDKSGASGPGFARLLRRHPEAPALMPLLAAARRVKGIPLLAPAARLAASAPVLPENLRVSALGLYRAAVCAPFVEPY